MSNTLGGWYACVVCASELLVSKSGDGRLECCGRPMDLRSNAVERAEGGPARSNTLGVRSRCARCGTSVLCTSGGPGQARCCGTELSEVITADVERAG